MHHATTSSAIIGHDDYDLEGIGQVDALGYVHGDGYTMRDSSIKTEDGDLEQVNEFTTNPLHGSSHTFRKTSLNEPIRTWILNVFPEVDAPTMHAIDEAFRSDGITKLKDIVDYMNEGVLDIHELKDYARAGKLKKSQAIVLVQAVQDVMQDADVDRQTLSGDPLRTSRSRMSHGGGIGDGGEMAMMMNILTDMRQSMQKAGIMENADTNGDKGTTNSLSGDGNTISKGNAIAPVKCRGRR